MIPSMLLLCCNCVTLKPNLGPRPTQQLASFPGSCVLLSPPLEPGNEAYTAARFYLTAAATPYAAFVMHGVKKAVEWSLGARLCQ